MPDTPANPHDIYFRQMMDDLPSVEALLSDRLPADFQATVIPGSLEQMPGTYIDGQLGLTHSDVVYRLRLRCRTGGPARAEIEHEVIAFLLFEHKSAPDPLTALQLLRYQLGIWTRWLEHKEGLPLPPILSIVVHQGPPVWSYPVDFHGLFSPMPRALRPAIPDFAFVLIDLGALADSTLPQHRRLYPMLLALKYARRRDLRQMLQPILGELGALSRMEIQQTLVYLAANPVGVTVEEIAEAADAARASGADTVGIIEFLEERGLKRGLEKGLEAGREKGREEGLTAGQRRALSKLLTKRFGPLPEEVLSNLGTAELDQVERWFDAALDGVDVRPLISGFKAR